MNTLHQNTESTPSDGPKLSKKALKRDLKAKNKAKAVKSEADDALDGAKYYENRIQSIRAIKDAGENPYPHKFDTFYGGKDVALSIPQFCQTYERLEKNEMMKNEIVCLMGRVKLIRSLGASLRFFVIEADDGSVQLFAQEEVWKSETDFETMLERTKRGDIVGARGHPGRTKTGELSLYVKHLEVLSPCLRTIPSFKYGFKEQELRYRQRYLDFILNPEKREIFYMRSRLINYIRRFLDERGFLEVETPTLNFQAGGAIARPFTTHHNELAIPMYMRIATELNLKMLVVGGIDRLYEIGKQFRNESIDLTHNPEFTSVEFYWAYRDYDDLMAVTEQMLSAMVLELKGSHRVKICDNEGRERMVDFQPPYRRIDFLAGIEEAGGFSIPRPLECEETRAFLSAKCQELGVLVPEPKTVGKLLDKLCDHLVESQTEQPTFLINHPVVLSPLAKIHRGDSQLTERFELFVCGMEMCNAYTELNDPDVQRARFLEQAKLRLIGDDESMKVDEGYLLAMEYGMPPMVKRDSSAICLSIPKAASHSVSSAVSSNPSAVTQPSSILPSHSSLLAFVLSLIFPSIPSSARAVFLFSFVSPTALKR